MKPVAGIKITSMQRVKLNAYKEISLLSHAPMTNYLDRESHALINYLDRESHALINYLDRESTMINKHDCNKIGVKTNHGQLQKKFFLIHLELFLIYIQSCYKMLLYKFGKKCM